ncbi:hypothetical protein BC833DRAFT_582531 [Globomyces pollinis-pini]|nr:hypothetical protein BC833DRAFT_582531 [Globomyces pollinis-pini]
MSLQPENSIDEEGFSWPSIGASERLNETEEQSQLRIDKIAEHVKGILEALGEDPEREGIKKTPVRYAKALMFLTRGYEKQLQTVVNDAVFEEFHDEMVMVKNIPVHSLCEHHLVPIIGTMTIAYIPNKDVIGLSKLARIADMFSQRLQVQERLTKQVATALMAILKPRGVAVTMEASHMCMVMRGVQKTGSTTVTSCMLGIFRTNPKTREEFLQLSK